MGLKEVLKKVSEINEFTELASQKVELGVKDYDVLMSRVKNISAGIVNSAKLYKELYDKIKIESKQLLDFENQLRDISSESNSQYEKDESNARELGLDTKPIDVKRKELSNEVYKNFQEIKKAQNLR